MSQGNNLCISNRCSKYQVSRATLMWVNGPKGQAGILTLGTPGKYTHNAVGPPQSTVTA